MPLVFVATLSVASATDSVDGEKLYQEHCAACHSLGGEGGIGLPLSMPSVMSSIDDDYIRKTIRLGRPGRIMPAFKDFSDAEVEAIVAYVRRWGESRLPAHAEPVSGDAEVGAKVFAQHCSQCHGEELQGGKGTGVTFSRHRDFQVMPPALNNPGFLAAASDTMLEYIITHGREGSPMPAFGKTLSEEQVHDVIAFLRSLGDKGKQLAEEDTEEKPSLTLEFESPYGFEETVEVAREAIRSHNFRSFPDRFLEQGLTDEFSVNQRQIIIRFCNFANLYEALKIEPRLGTILPCKITILEQKDGSVKVYAANIEAQAKLFNNKQLDLTLDNIKESYRDILDEITL